ncbi:MAG: DNA polymerase beta superfamily protein [Cyclobacteriaceae bacterium]
MQNKIRNFLDQLAAEKGVKILFACESGSRAWGFPSPDSDYDIRVIYKHDLDWYLNLHQQADTLEQMHEDLDISGWELKKLLLLMAKSNVTVFEWIQSPLIYRQVPEFLESLHKLAVYFFSPIAAMHHYQQLTAKFLEKINQEEQAKLKDFFYALRAVLSGAWIGKYQEIPPLEIIRLQALLPNSYSKKINQLKDIKAEKEEKYGLEIDIELIQLLQNIYDNNKTIAADLPAGKGDMTRLSNFFIRVLKEV